NSPRAASGAGTRGDGACGTSPASRAATSYGIASTTGTRYVRACSMAMMVVAAASARPAVYVRAPTAEASAIWSTSHGRGPDVGSSPTTSTSGTCACTASARVVSVFVKPAPYVEVAAATRPEAR